MSTLLLGLVMTLLVGTILYQRIAAGLVEQAVSNAELDAAVEVRNAQDSLNRADRGNDASLSASAQEAMSQISPAGQDDRLVVLTQALDSDREAIVTPRSSNALDPGDIPIAVREALAEQPARQQVMVVTMDLDGQPGTPVVVVASRLDIFRAGAYDVSLVYPMQREEETLGLIRRWFTAGGLGLLVLVAGVSWVATRLVTEPVGRAARVSQQLASGDLDSRLTVRGSDELARLATSFNTMADSLQHQIHQLERLSRLQQRFVSDVSHELRTPLTTMRMAGEVLYASRDDFPAHVGRSTELLYQELDRFEELLTELLEVSRYDSGAVVLEQERADLVALVHSAVDGVSHLAARAGSTVTMDVPDHPVLTDIDPRRISRVLRNLLGNAVEHGEGGPLEVSVAEGEGVVTVSVRDYGIGLQPGHEQRVFERFWRADPARVRTTGGTGLGLSIALEDARLHGGWLQASGRPGEGACFRLTLPREAGRALVGEPPPVPLRAALDAAVPQTPLQPEEPAQEDASSGGPPAASAETPASLGQEHR